MRFPILFAGAVLCCVLAGPARAAVAVTTFATTGAASLPDGLTFDSSGNLYVANMNINTISKVTPGGVVSTFINGGALNGPKGLALDSSGNLFVANYLAGGRILKYTSAGALAANPFNTTALGGQPDQMVIDAGNNLYVYLVSGSVVKITPAGTVSTYVSGIGTLAGGLCFDASGNLFITDYNNNKVDKVPPGGGSFSVFASGFSSPRDIVKDGSGNLYVTNGAANTISKVTTLGAVSTYADNTSGLFNYPYTLAFDASGNLYVANGLGTTVCKVVPVVQFNAASESVNQSAGTFSVPVTLAGTPGLALSTFASGFNAPDGMAFDTSGNLYVTNFSGNTVSKVTPAGTVSTFASGFNHPADVAFDTSGNLYVANYNANTVWQVTPGGVASTFATGFNLPDGLAFDTSGNLYVANYNDITVSKVGPGGGAASTFATGFNGPTGLAFDSAGNLYVVNRGNNTVSKVTPSGAVSLFASGFSTPIYLRFDTAGVLYVANAVANTVSQVTPGGVVSLFASGFSAPTGLAFDSAGDLCVANWGLNTVSKYSATVTVPFALGGTAASGTDYSGLTGSPLTFGSGQTTANITGTLLSHPGAAQTLTFTLGAPTNIAVLGSQTTNTLTIVEPPLVTSSTANLAANAATLVIAGFGFDPTAANNTVIFNDGAAGNVTAATATSLTVTFTTKPASAGSLTAVVTTNGQSSGAAVQVATVTPVVTASAAILAANAATVVIAGFGFDPAVGNNTVLFNDSAVGSVTAVTATSLTVTFTSKPASTGSLTAIVTTNSQSSGAAVQVATVTPVVRDRKSVV